MKREAYRWGPIETRALALEDVEISLGENAVVVNDGNDIWATTREAWDACESGWNLVVREDETAEEPADYAQALAYEHLCFRLPAVVSKYKRGALDEMNLLACQIVADGLMAPEDVFAIWGIDVGSVEATS